MKYLYFAFVFKQTSSIECFLYIYGADQKNHNLTLKILKSRLVEIAKSFEKTSGFYMIEFWMFTRLVYAQRNQINAAPNEN